MVNMYCRGHCFELRGAASIKRDGLDHAHILPAIMNKVSFGFHVGRLPLMETAEEDLRITELACQETGCGS